MPLSTCGLASHSAGLTVDQNFGPYVGGVLFVTKDVPLEGENRQYHVTLSWGDGAVSAGTLSAPSTGSARFLILHRFPDGSDWTAVRFAQVDGTGTEEPFGAYSDNDNNSACQILGHQKEVWFPIEGEAALELQEGDTVLVEEDGTVVAFDSEGGSGSSDVPAAEPAADLDAPVDVVDPDTGSDEDMARAFPVDSAPPDDERWPILALAGGLLLVMAAGGWYYARRNADGDLVRVDGPEPSDIGAAAGDAITGFADGATFGGAGHLRDAIPDRYRRGYEANPESAAYVSGDLASNLLPGAGTVKKADQAADTIRNVDKASDLSKFGDSATEGMIESFSGTKGLPGDGPRLPPKPPPSKTPDGFEDAADRADKMGRSNTGVPPQAEKQAKDYWDPDEGLDYEA